MLLWVDSVAARADAARAAHGAQATSLQFSTFTDNYTTHAAAAVVESYWVDWFVTDDGSAVAS